MSLVLLNSGYVVEKRLALYWLILAPVEQTLVGSWSIYGAVQQTMAFSWSIGEAVQQAMAFSWHILREVERGLVCSWRIMTQFSSAPAQSFLTIRRRKRFVPDDGLFQFRSRPVSIAERFKAGSSAGDSLRTWGGKILYALHFRAGSRSGNPTRTFSWRNQV